jgi:hypothetical protein
MSRLLLRALSRPLFAANQAARAPPPAHAPRGSSSQPLHITRCRAPHLLANCGPSAFFARSFTASAPKSDESAAARPPPAAARDDGADDAARKDSAFVSLVVRMFGNSKTERTAIRGLAPYVS